MPPEASFLGTGWAFPPGFTTGGAGVEMVSGAEDVEQSLHVLLSTRPGERVMQEPFGCDLASLQFEEVDQSFVNTLDRLVTDAILRYEPRVRLDRVDVEQSETGGMTLTISVHYTIRSTNSRYNLVFPFYLDEATQPGA